MPISRVTRIACTLLLVSAAPLTASAQDLTLGFLTAESGPYVSLARSNEIAARIAVDEINAGGGVNGRKLRLVLFDTAGSPAQTVAGLRKLAEDDKVLAIVGPFSSAQVQVTSAVGDRVGIVTMSMASSAPKLVAGTKFSFRNTSDEAYMFDRTVRTVRNRVNPSATASIAYANDDAVSKTMGEKVMPSVFDAAGIKVQRAVDFKLSAFDLSTQVAQLKGSPTDLVGVSAPPEAAIKLVQELRRQGHAGRIVAPSLIADPDMPQRMGKEGDGAIIPTSFHADLSDRTRQFVSEFAKRASASGAQRSMPGQFDAATYDIVHYYAWAMREAKVTGAADRIEAERSALRDALRRMNAFPALVGPVSFNADNDAVKPVYVLEIRDRKWRLLDTYSVPVAK